MGNNSSFVPNETTQKDKQSSRNTTVQDLRKNEIKS